MPPNGAGGQGPHFLEGFLEEVEHELCLNCIGFEGEDTQKMECRCGAGVTRPVWGIMIRSSRPKQSCVERSGEQVQRMGSHSLRAPEYQITVFQCHTVGSGALLTGGKGDIK